MQTMNVGGADLLVDIKGKGLPFIWTHGLTMSMEIEDKWGILPWLDMSKHCQLIRYDVRGHGKSQATLNATDYQWPELASDVLALADNLGIDKFIAGGASMGCGVTLHVALKAPERILGLVFGMPPTAWDKRPLVTKQYLYSAKINEEKGLDALMKMHEHLPIPEIFKEEPKLIQFVNEKLSQYNPQVLIKLLKGAAASDLPHEDQLVFKLPALILAWNHFINHPLATAQKLHQLLPNSKLLIGNTLTEIRANAREIIPFIEHLTQVT